MTRSAARSPRTITAPVSLVKAQAAPVAVAPVEGAGTITVAVLAERAGATPRDMRKWLRSSARAAQAQDALPGKGGRYAFTESDASALLRAYGAAKAQRGTTAAGAAIVAALAPVE